MERIYQRLHRLAEEYPNGFTVEIKEFEFITSGWVIALRDAHPSVSIEDLDKVLSAAKGTTYLTCYLKNGTIFNWEIVLVTQDENEAIAIGKENVQMAIYNLETQELKFL